MQWAYWQPSGDDYALIVIKSGFPITLTAFYWKPCLIASHRRGGCMTCFNQCLCIADRWLRYRIGERHMRNRNEMRGPADCRLRYRIGKRHMRNVCKINGMCRLPIADSLSHRGFDMGRFSGAFGDCRLPIAEHYIASAEILLAICCILYVIAICDLAIAWSQ